MPTGWRDWKVVLRALQRLGVAQQHEDEQHVFLVLFPNKMQPLRKWWVTPEIEEHLLQKLRLAPEEYIEAIRAVEAEDRGEPSTSRAVSISQSEILHKKEMARCLEQLREGCESGAREGNANITLRLESTTLIQAALSDRDELHLQLEVQIHAVMRQHPTLEWVQLTLPVCEPFTVGRPGYDD
jgi:hypothetical protein